VFLFEVLHEVADVDVSPPFLFGLAAAQAFLFYQVAHLGLYKRDKCRG
jgi:hypothetical protein